MDTPYGRVDFLYASFLAFIKGPFTRLHCMITWTLINFHLFSYQTKAESIPVHVSTVYVTEVWPLVHCMYR